MVVPIIFIIFVKQNKIKSYIMEVFLTAVARALSKKHGDHGSCVMGYELLLDGAVVVPQPAQGSSTCDYVYGIITAILIEMGYDEKSITRNYGVMD